ncbi:hypothetical protein E3N88_20359 [Mikania micrantha]|uniref:BSD domain-containing protein n=1 Tax=Mikania micrantha TaxID=192012 RepID=A0A5N6NGS0_9ASTR|nr:hypothetical protein E3N88_20359 [Mikania micrantha]
MSWFARSIANTFQLDVDDDEQRSPEHNTNTDQPEVEEDDSPLTPGRGVKEDLSEIKKTLTRQFWGVASFLAPPPSDEHSNQQSDPSDPEDAAPEVVSGLRKDFAEIGGRFCSGISKLSSNIDVSEITKLASNLLQLSPDGDDYVLSKDAKAIGVTDEVLTFVRDITMHPETWLDFPLTEDDDDGEEFELSDAQQEHALTVESLAPRLAALRIELCPGYMSEGSFWKIYFVLLHPRLEPHAAELLSTPEGKRFVWRRRSSGNRVSDRPGKRARARNSEAEEEEEKSLRRGEKRGEKKGDRSAGKGRVTRPAVMRCYFMQIVKARASLTHELKAHSSSQIKEEEGSTNNLLYSEHKPESSQEEHSLVPLEISTTQSTKSVISTDPETEKHYIPSEDEVQIVDKSVIQEEPRNKTKTEDQNMSFNNTSSIVVEDKDEDDWLKEDTSEHIITGTTSIPIEHDEDVSFSDLEEDDDGGAQTNYRKTASGSDSSTKDSRDWVQLGSDSSTVEHAGRVSGAQNSEMKESNDWLDVDDIDVHYRGLRLFPIPFVPRLGQASRGEAAAPSCFPISAICKLYVSSRNLVVPIDGWTPRSSIAIFLTRRLNRLSKEDVLWLKLLSYDFPTNPSSSSSSTKQSHKSIYQIRFEKDKVKKLLAERRVVLRIESQIHEHTRKLHAIEVQLEDENAKIKAAIDELKRLRTVKEASTALKVWQPEIIHTRQKQIVENCSVPVDFRINALEMEIKLCKQHMSGFLKAREEETKRLEAAKERLSKVKYHPLQSFDVENESRHSRRISEKNAKRQGLQCIGADQQYFRSGSTWCPMGANPYKRTAAPAFSRSLLGGFVTIGCLFVIWVPFVYAWQSWSAHEDDYFGIRILSRCLVITSWAAKCSWPNNKGELGIWDTDLGLGCFRLWASIPVF